MTAPPIHRSSMSGLLHPPRSRFMINDILSGNPEDRGPDDDGRSPSPQPRDLRMSLNSSSGGSTISHHNHHHHNNNHHHVIDDSDTDSSTGMDDHSISSNGKYNNTDGNLYNRIYFFFL